MTTGDSQPPLVLILIPARDRSHHRHHANKQSRRALASPPSLAKLYDPACYPSNRTCTADSSGCAGHGVCVQSDGKSESGNATTSAKKGSCWSCQCAAGYLGQTCVKADYTL